ncbi:hypothetical protein Tsubulata_017157 [Turnera subulata]|uniref:Uncharacterized protein n=1 Tax=Turnera subulata TaxID=218843 RepID=A0A9Q0FDJ8_9ROSI|nr:hypothetical protein Tsubulata_017157 [Turnera subulata]
MAAIAGLSKSCLGMHRMVDPRYSKPPFAIPSCNEVGCNIQRAVFSSKFRRPVSSEFLAIPQASGRLIPQGSFGYFPAQLRRSKHVLSVGRGYYQTRDEEDVPREPFWLTLFKDTTWALKSLFVFLIEQPRQLKYIEWPGFGNTVKTATLTLVLVALLIVALSSVDAVLCYLLALILRRAP